MVEDSTDIIRRHRTGGEEEIAALTRKVERLENVIDTAIEELEERANPPADDDDGYFGGGHFPLYPDQCQRFADLLRRMKEQA